MRDSCTVGIPECKDPRIFEYLCFGTLILHCIVMYGLVHNIYILYYTLLYMYAVCWKSHDVHTCMQHYMRMWQVCRIEKSATLRKRKRMKRACILHMTRIYVVCYFECCFAISHLRVIRIASMQRWGLWSYLCMSAPSRSLSRAVKSQSVLSKFDRSCKHHSTKIYTNRHASKST